MATDASQQISSLKKLIDGKKKKALGYADEDLDKNSLFNKVDINDFLNSVDPYEFLTKFNQFHLDNESLLFFKENEKAMKIPADMQLICDDLKVCGRREMGLLIRIRHKYQEILKREVKRVAEEERAKAKELEEPEDEDAKIDRELEETMQRMEKEKKRLAKKEKVATDKSELRKKMSVIATTTLDNDEDLMMSRRLWDDIRKKGFEGAGEKSESENDSDDGEETKAAREASDFSDEDDDGEEGEDEMSSGDELFDHKEAHVAAMAE